MDYIQNTISKAPEEASTLSEATSGLPRKGRDPVSIGGGNKDFTKTYQAHAKSIYRFVLFKTNSYQDAEDITAEVFFRYLKKGAGLKPESILPWLYVVAGNLCVNHYREKGKAGQLDRPEEKHAEHQEPWENSVAWQQIKELGQKEQQIIYLRAIEDKSFKEIATVLGKKEGAIKMMFYRAIGNLRALLKEGNNDQLL